MDDTTRRHVFRTTQLEEADGPGLNPTQNRTMGEIIAARFSRRGFLRGSMATVAISATVSPMALMSAGEAKAQGASGSAFDFTEVMAGVDADHHVAEGYDADILLRWGDKVFADAPEFDAPFARLEYVGRDRFDISYFRHTGRWWTVFRGVTLAEALALLESEVIFHPIT